MPKVRIEGFLGPVNGVHQLGYSFKGEELTLDWDENRVRGNERVQGHRSKRGRTVNKNVVVLFGNGQGQFSIGSRALLGRQDQDWWPPGFGRRASRDIPNSVSVTACFGRRLAQQNIIDCPAVFVFRHTNAARRITLGVGVDQ